MEQPASLETTSAPPPGLPRGVIRQLTHLSNGTHMAVTHLVAAHNCVGYGYIRTPAGDVFFDASAIANLRFDQLTRDMTVEMTLEQAPYLRASRVTVVSGESADQHE